MTTMSTIQVAASADDGYSMNATWPGIGFTSITGGVARLGAAPTEFYAFGARFLSVPIPQGATINSASLSLKVYNLGLATQLDVTIFGDAHDDAAAFAATTDTATGSPGYRTRTTPNARWNVGTATWTAEAWVSTPDLSPIVQARVDSSGWAENNDLAFIIANTATTLPAANEYRTVYCWDTAGNVSGAKFDCTFTTGSGAASILHHLVIVGGM